MAGVNQRSSASGVGPCSVSVMRLALHLHEGEQPDGDPDSDGDIVGAALPRRTRGAWPEGRGYLAERGSAELIQVALPDAF